MIFSKIGDMCRLYYKCVLPKVGARRSLIMDTTSSVAHAHVGSILEARLTYYFIAK